MNKTNAIEIARRRVGGIYNWGDNYRFNYFDESVNAWRESLAESYFNSQFRRSQELICETMKLMGFGESICFDAMARYCNGKWTDHLNDMIQKYS